MIRITYFAPNAILEKLRLRGIPASLTVGEEMNVNDDLDIVKVISPGSEKSAIDKAIDEVYSPADAVILNNSGATDDDDGDES